MFYRPTFQGTPVIWPSAWCRLSSPLERAFLPAVKSSDSRDCPVAEGPPNVSEEGQAACPGERGVTSWGWDLGSVAGYSFCAAPASRVGMCFALQRWFVEPLPSTLTLPVRSSMQRLESQHRTVTRYQRVLSQERSGEPQRE